MSAKTIYYNGPALAHAPVTVAAVSDQPLRNGVAYTVSDELAALLLEREDWATTATTAREDEPWTLFEEIDGVNEAIAEAMWNAGYRSRADVARAVADGGWQRLKDDVSGIGEARAKKIALWAQDESESVTNG